MTDRRIVGAGVAALVFVPAVAVAVAFELDWKLRRLMRKLHERRYGGELSWPS